MSLPEDLISDDPALDFTRPGEVRFRRASPHGRARTTGGRDVGKLVPGSVARRTPSYTIKVRRTGMWPTSWTWQVFKDGFRIDYGQSMTEGNAIRTAERLARAHERERVLRVDV